MSNASGPMVAGLQTGSQIRTLDPNKMFALIVIEQNRDALAQGELVQAEQNLRVAEANLERAKAGLSEVRGAIIGANIMIERELAADGFTLEEWQKIKAEKEKLHQEETGQNPAPVEEATPVQEKIQEAVPETPSARITHLKRRSGR